MPTGKYLYAAMHSRGSRLKYSLIRTGDSWFKIQDLLYRLAFISFQNKLRNVDNNSWGPNKQGWISISDRKAQNSPSPINKSDLTKNLLLRYRRASIPGWSVRSVFEYSPISEALKNSKIGASSFCWIGPNDRYTTQNRRMPVSFVYFVHFLLASRTNLALEQTSFVCKMCVSQRFAKGPSVFYCILQTDRFNKSYNFVSRSIWVHLVFNFYLRMKSLDFVLLKLGNGTRT